MWWMIAAGIAAFLGMLYVIAKSKTARSDYAGAGGQNAILDKPIEMREVISHAHNFHGFFTNDGLDGLLSNMQAKELSLNKMCDALAAIGAQPIVPLLKQASLEYERYAHEADVLAAPIGAPEHQEQVKVYLGRMRELQSAIDKLDLNVPELTRAYAGSHGMS